MKFKDHKIKSADITPKEVFKNRRNLIKILTLGSLAAGLNSSLQSEVFAVGESNKKYNDFIKFYESDHDTINCDGNGNGFLKIWRKYVGVTTGSDLWYFSLI